MCQTPVGSDVPDHVLLPGSHPLRLAENFHQSLLSSSQPFSYYKCNYKVSLPDLSRFSHLFFYSVRKYSVSASFQNLFVNSFLNFLYALAPVFQINYNLVFDTLRIK